MTFGNIEVTKEMMPSYQIGVDYPNRQFQFMQDTITSALQANQAMQGQPVQTQPVSNNQQSQWGGNNA